MPLDDITAVPELVAPGALASDQVETPALTRVDVA